MAKHVVLHNNRQADVSNDNATTKNKNSFFAVGPDKTSCQKCNSEFQPPRSSLYSSWAAKCVYCWEFLRMSQTKHWRATGRFLARSSKAHQVTTWPSKSYWPRKPTPSLASSAMLNPRNGTIQRRVQSCLSLSRSATSPWHGM